MVAEARTNGTNIAAIVQKLGTWKTPPGLQGFTAGIRSCVLRPSANRIEQ